MQSVPITTNVSSNPVQSRCIRSVCQWLFPGTPVSSLNKIDHRDITEILLKEALNTLTLELLFVCDIVFCLNNLFSCAFLGDYEVLDGPNITTSGNYTNRYRSYRGVSVPTPCPGGSYCPEGTKEEKEFLCPAGSYSNKTSLNNYTQCTPCDPGYYCSGEGQ